jgi:hypothetical protein
MNHSGAGKIVSFLQTKELGPRHWPASATPRQPVFPYPPRALPKFLEAEEVARNSIIPVVASQLLCQLLVPLPDRTV